MIFTSLTNSGPVLSNEFQFYSEPVTLLLVFGFNNTANIRYLQLFNALANPGNGTTAFIDILIPANASYSLEPFYSDNNGGWYFSIGLIAIVSTTPLILTKSATPDLEITMQAGRYQ